ncbi:cytosolic carboxypeptidase 6-like [Homalodisca vitripennis]|uniref:cytosolic carboxypeptidase 6-like n=1 Tax=Homalodisca vitripennis TaxID=197043 RepID=UPI001EEA3DE6|nr:cytosolic carboxypeptidase 6-like [Homalodisca vitripennis]
MTLTTRYRYGSALALGRAARSRNDFWNPPESSGPVSGGSILSKTVSRGTDKCKPAEERGLEVSLRHRPRRRPCPGSRIDLTDRRCAAGRTGGMGRPSASRTPGSGENGRFRLRSGKSAIDVFLNLSKAFLNLSKAFDCVDYSAQLDKLESRGIRRLVAESEDSENEGGMGNVSRVIMRPPGHSGKAKRGHLCFDASFESGNLGRVDLVSEFEYDLFIRPDTCNPKVRLWFYFTVDNIRVDQHVVFNIVNFSKKRMCFRDGMTPLVKSTSRSKWTRMPNKHVYYHRSPYHWNHTILTLTFGFDREDDVYHFAFTYPYSYSKCQAHLEILERKKIPHLRRELLSNSVQNRRLDLLTITHPKNMTSGRKMRVVVILSRIHPGETPSSYVCQGIIDFLISNHPMALALRDHVIFKIFPMMNPDGVFLGNYRSTLMGADLNRVWSQISRWIHPTLHAAFTFISNLDQDKNMELDFVMDIHSHSSLQGVFVYGNTYDDVYRYERHIVFPKLLAQNTDGFEQANTMYNRDLNKANSSRRVFCEVLKDSVNCYSIIVSCYGYRHPSAPGIHYYTEESYCRLGRNIVRTCLDYYRIIGVVSSGEGEKKPSTAKSRQSRKATYSGALSNRSFPLHPHPPRATSSSSEASTKLNINLDIQPMSADSRKFHHKRGRHHKRTTESLVQSRQWQVAEESAPVKPPSLSIIDFNSLTRGGLDESMGLTKTRSKSHTKKSHKRKRKTKKPPPVSPETAVVDEVNSPAEVEDTSDSP